MRLDENDRGRRTANPAASDVINDGDDVILPTTADHFRDDATRCRRCSHPLSAARSVRLGIGPTCAAIERYDLTSEVFEGVLAAC